MPVTNKFACLTYHIVEDGVSQYAVTGNLSQATPSWL